MARVAFLGLGVMGYPMAGHLAAAGHEVRVYNRTGSKAERWVEEHGGSCHATPRETVDGCALAFSCVGRDEDLLAVALGGEGAVQGMAAGSLYVDHTTTSDHAAREVHAAAAGNGVGFVDAPVSGGQAGAENGALTIMCGGSEEDYRSAEPVMAAYARSSRLLGGVGAGQLAKMVNQICIAGLVQGLAEGLHFARCAGLDAKAVVDVISKGAAGSWQMENRYETMVDDEYEHGFAVDWMRKDLGICLDAARRRGARLPVAALVDQFYGDVQAMGGGRWDTSSLLRLLERGKQE